VLRDSGQTLIIDSGFTRFVPRGQIQDRCVYAPIWPSHLSQAWQGDSPDYTGFYSGSPPPYVLLAASEKDSIAIESSDGGVFTQNLVATILGQKQKPLTYRELILTTNRAMDSELQFDQQIAVASGVYIDRLIFSMPRETPIEVAPIEKLCVFVDAPSFELCVEAEDHFLRVPEKTGASVALRVGPNGSTIIERLDGLTAMHSSREISMPATGPRSIASVLNWIARFNHYLALKPPLDQKPSGLARLRFRRMRDGIRLYVRNQTQTGRWDSRSLVSMTDGVARRSLVPGDHQVGIKITNVYSKDMYPHLLHFNPSNYAIQVRF
jgi:hypothetical protein